MYSSVKYWESISVSLSRRDLPVKTGVTTVTLVRLQFWCHFFKLNCSQASDGSKQVKILQNSAAKTGFNGFLSQVTFSVAQLTPDFYSAAARFNSPPQRGMLETDMSLL